MKNINFKKILKELVIVVILVFVISNIMSYIRKPDIESKLVFDSQKIELIDGKIFDTKSLNNKPFILHFWATWCPACRLESPNIQTVSTDYNVLTIAINSGSNQDLKNYMNKNGFNFNVINDINSVWSSKFKIKNFPTTFIYNGDGELKFTEVGYTTTAGLIARVKMIE